MVIGTDLTLVVPAYNEEEGIGTVLETLCSESVLQGAEIIVVDDGSSDETGAIAQSFSRVHLIRHRTNRGYGSSLASGVEAATRRFVIWVDADGQHRTEDLVKVAKTMVEDDLSYCIGIRDSSSYEVPSRRIGKFFLKLAVRIAAGHAVKDFNSGLRGFKTAVIRPYLSLLPRRFGASTTTTLLMLKRGYFGREVPIVVGKRIGKSSVRSLRDGAGTLQIILRIFLLFTPMRFFGGVGASFILLGLIYGLIRGIMARHGFPVAGALGVILGVQSLFFGLISDQISLMRLERLEHEIRENRRHSGPEKDRLDKS